VLALGIAALLAVLAWVERQLYLERGEGQVRLSLGFSPTRVARGDEVELLLRAEHVGRLPILWLTVYVELPPDLACAAAVGRTLIARLALPYRGGVVRHYRVRPTQRGLMRIERLRAEFSDPLGLVEQRLETRAVAELLSHPHPRDANLWTPMRALIGAVERPSLFEDPTAFRGVRPYRPGDPLRRVHWPQTARTGELMAREYATAVDAQLYLALNLATHQPHWAGVDRDRLEAVIETAAGLAIEACRVALPVGLVVNGVAFEATPVTRIAPGASPRHLTVLLDVLARLAPYPAESAETLLAALWALPPEPTLLLISAGLPDAWRIGLSDLGARRDVVLVLLAAPGEPVEAVRGVRVERLERPAAADAARTAPA